MIEEEKLELIRDISKKLKTIEKVITQSDDFDHMAFLARAIERMVKQVDKLTRNDVYFKDQIDQLTQRVENLEQSEEDIKFRLDMP